MNWLKDDWIKKRMATGVKLQWRTKKRSAPAKGAFCSAVLISAMCLHKDVDANAGMRRVYKTDLTRPNRQDGQRTRRVVVHRCSLPATSPQVSTYAQLMPTAACTANTLQRLFDLPRVEKGHLANTLRRLFDLPRVEKGHPAHASQRICDFPRVAEGFLRGHPAHASQRIGDFLRVAEGFLRGHPAHASQRICDFPRVAEGCSREYIKAIHGDTRLVQD